MGGEIKKLYKKGSLIKKSSPMVFNSPKERPIFKRRTKNGNAGIIGFNSTKIK
jgi:hypothetical protein